MASREKRLAAERKLRQRVKAIEGVATLPPVAETDLRVREARLEHFATTLAVHQQSVAEALGKLREAAGDVALRAKAIEASFAAIDLRPSGAMLDLEKRLHDALSAVNGLREEVRLAHESRDGALARERTLKSEINRLQSEGVVPIWLRRVGEPLSKALDEGKVGKEGVKAIRRIARWAAGFVDEEFVEIETANAEMRTEAAEAAAP